MTRADLRLADFAHLRGPDRRVGIERERGIFIVEGELALRALLASDHAVRAVLVDQRRLKALGPLLEDVDAPVYAARAAVVEEAHRFRLPPRCASRRRAARVPSRRRRSPPEHGACSSSKASTTTRTSARLYRNAAAFGVDGVVLDPTTADPLYRRVVRVSLGHVLAVPTRSRRAE